eukprot:GHVS01053174.1.p1 GENE.GHVS01053174.1~~GHVS01053174.1.p1  ORF type:complete len:151 (+),score=13.73 GHVS01053174.1:116-568(+)
MVSQAHPIGARIIDCQLARNRILASLPPSRSRPPIVTTIMYAKRKGIKQDGFARPRHTQHCGSRPQRCSLSMQRIRIICGEGDCDGKSHCRVDANKYNNRHQSQLSLHLASRPSKEASRPPSRSLPFAGPSKEASSSVFRQNNACKKECN